ncbi:MULTISPECIES: hypothetical protein [Nocardia]|uniref:hypothetical protein n=1 Tax=Nocardia abscessus TaxID=120957 RepID=UPI002453F3C7|nr:hypothetical protein [Nocardia abscessus]
MRARTLTPALFIGVVAVAGAGCGATTTPQAAGSEQRCQADRFATPFTSVDPCSPEQVLTAAVAAVFDYRPSEQADQRAALRVARALLDPGFAERAEPAALVWAPVTAAQWQQWRATATTITTTARVTGDDHPADTATTAHRVLAVELQPTGQPPIRWTVYARVTRATDRSGWLLSGLEVAS